MTGNDIVDIKAAAAESNWKRKGFIEKIFTPLEQQYIKASTMPDEMVWKLWTMKESAYKIYTRQFGGRFFAPQKFSCTLINQTEGTVDYDNACYQTSTCTAKEFIYTIARPTGISNTELINPCFYLPQIPFLKQQQFIYKKLINFYRSTTGVPQINMVIIKDKNGIPFLNCESKWRIPISITHHGRFAAFTIH
jgi:phosphopantetheinyl transferase (holo-ACP synthase)